MLTTVPSTWTPCSPQVPGLEAKVNNAWANSSAKQSSVAHWLGRQCGDIVGYLTGLPKERFGSVGRGSSDREDQHAPYFGTRVLEEPGRPPLSEGQYRGVFRKRAVCWKRPVGRPGLRRFGRGVGGSFDIAVLEHSVRPSRNRRFFPQGCSKIAGSAISEY
jgi:hypothetical protein